MKLWTIQSGCDVRVPSAITLSPCGRFHGGPERASERSTPLANPRARSGTSADRLPDRRVRRHAGEQLVRAEPQRDAHVGIERVERA